MLDPRANYIEYAAQLELIRQANNLITDKREGRAKKAEWNRLFQAARYLDILSGKANFNPTTLTNLTFIYECLISGLNINRFPVPVGNINVPVPSILVGIQGPPGPAGASSYLYFAWADDNAGTGFTTTFDPNKLYLAFVQSSSPILTLTSTNFIGKWFRVIGVNGNNGTNGTNGTNGLAGANGAAGNTILFGSGAPSNGLGTNGNFYIDTTAHVMYGPKASEIWPAGFSLVGPSGSSGLDGRTIITGVGVPGVGIGNNGDLYLDTSTYLLYAPKASGTWPAGVSLTGPAGATGGTGTTGSPGTNGTDGINGANTYLYVAYADLIDGANYILVQSTDPTATLSAFDTEKSYIAILSTTTPIGLTITSANFSGLWARYRGDGDRWATFSNTTLTIGTGSKLLFVEPALAYTTGQFIVIAEDGVPANLMEGLVVTYNPISGQLSVSVSAVTGSGTFSSWDVNLQAGLISPPTNTYGGISPTNITVGGLPSGSAIAGLTYDAIIQKMTQFYYVPVWTSFLITGQATTVETGTTIPTPAPFAWSITINSGVVTTIDLKDVSASSTLVANTPNDGTQSQAIGVIVLNSDGATQIYKGTLHDTGVNPSDIDSPLFTITARYKRFWAPVTSTPATSTTVRGLASSGFQTAGNSFTMVTGTTLIKFSVNLPPGVTIVSVTDTTNLFANLTSSYVLIGTVSVLDAGGTSRTYNQYEYNIATPYSVSANHVIVTT